jgi:hypothetical protein
MPQMQNRVQETTTTGGTGTLTLAGAVTGYITFASGFSTGTSLFYTIDNGIGEWEIGIGTLVTTGTLSRVTVIASSNGGALVNFGSGTKRVFCSAPTRSLVPDQDSKSGYVLTTDGTDPAWTQTLNGITIGNLTAAGGAFTTLSASSTVSGTGFSTYLASPPAIGGSSPAAGNFTDLSYTGTLTGGTGVITIGTNQIYKDASGNVGIGVTPSAWSGVVGLQISSGGSIYASTVNVAYGSNHYYDGAYRFVGNGYACIYYSNYANNGSHVWQVSALNSSGAGVAFTPTNAMTLTAAGVLQLGSAISLNPTTANALVVNSSGNVGIGTASPLGKVQINTPSGTAFPGSLALAIRDASSPTNGFNFNLEGVSTGDLTLTRTVSGTSTAVMSFARANGVVTMSAYGAGAATFSAAGVISSVSDETWKTKDGAPVDADAMLKKLEPGYWYYNDEKKDIFGADRQLGFYAQNVNAAIGPEAAPEPEEGKPWGYYDRSVLAVVVMSLQKALATIESLEARIAILGSKP